MGGVPVSTVEDADGLIVVGCREGAVEANESGFVVDLVPGVVSFCCLDRRLQNRTRVLFT